MRKLTVLITLILLVLASKLPAPARMIVGEWEPDKPLDLGAEWPDNLKALASRDGAVYVKHQNYTPIIGGGSEETVALFFTGNSEAFNKFLGDYAKLRDLPLTLTVHAGCGRVWAQSRKAVRFEWLVTMVRFVPGEVFKADAPKNKVGYEVSVELWLGGNVELDEVKAPGSIEVKSGGEIEDFIAKHQEKKIQVNKSQ